MVRVSSASCFAVAASFVPGTPWYDLAGAVGREMELLYKRGAFNRTGCARKPVELPVRPRKERHQRCLGKAQFGPDARQRLQRPHEPNLVAATHNKHTISPPNWSNPRSICLGSVSGPAAHGVDGVVQDLLKLCVEHLAGVVRVRRHNGSLRDEITRSTAGSPPFSSSAVCLSAHTGPARLHESPAAATRRQSLPRRVPSRRPSPPI